MCALIAFNFEVTGSLYGRRGTGSYHRRIRPIALIDDNRRLRLHLLAEASNHLAIRPLSAPTLDGFETPMGEFLLQMLIHEDNSSG